MVIILNGYNNILLIIELCFTIKYFTYLLVTF